MNRPIVLVRPCGNVRSIMATIRPFKGLRFNVDTNRLSSIVAPPYDVISPAEREILANQDPLNVVRLTLPEQNSDDRSKFVKYARSASQLEEWRRGGEIQLENMPAYYRYSQKFSVPGTDQVFERTKLVATIKVEPYDKKIVLPHEQTFPKHKEDRMRILEATRSHLECIFGLYEDPNQALHNLVTSAPAEDICDIVTSDDGIEHRFERIVNPDALNSISSAMAEKSVWIADGHHRYETALSFRQNLREKPGLIAEDFMMMALCSISDPGLVLLPTHRILKSMPFSADELKGRLAEQFDVRSLSNNELMRELQAVEAIGGRGLGIAMPGGSGLLAEIRNLDALVAEMTVAGGEDVKRLDVSILHGYVFAKLLGLTGHDFFTYTRLEQEALESVENGAPAAFLMNPPTVEDMRRIALSGDFMPQKSTYYYPKLLSGMVMWSLKDFEA
ncbi:MAG: DUF1015 domain-containing protein [Fimbriimonadaceae bacterium]